MEECKFKAGDLVMLKSGGPVMTVLNRKTQSNDFRCGWFTEDCFNSNVFSEESLVTGELKDVEFFDPRRVFYINIKDQEEGEKIMQNLKKQFEKKANDYINSI